MKSRVKFASSSLIATIVVLSYLLTALIVDAKQKARSVEAMAKAAQGFLATLSPEQKAKATFSFTDDQRFDWHFVPLERKGLPLKEMTEPQRKAALDLLKAALSAKGYTKATSIISLEPILAQLEGPNRRFPRDPQLYYVTIFGDPTKNDSWGWRFEGHHISQNFTVAKGKLIVDAPAFFGTNPAMVLADVPQKGLRVLGAEEDLARAFMLALDDNQRKQAIFEAKAPSDILSFDKRQAAPLDKNGIKASALNGKQFGLLEKLVEEYVANVPDDVAGARRAKFKSAKKEEIYFAWAGPVEKAQGGYKLESRDLTAAVTTEQAKSFQGHYYRLQTPTFLIEYDNTQNNANHVHSVWRDFTGDWGRDLLAEHYQATPHQNLAATTRPSTRRDGRSFLPAQEPEKPKPTNIGGGSNDSAPGVLSATAKLKPTILYKEKAKYTELARQNGVEGTVLVSAIFSKEGNIEGIRVVRGLPDGLNDEAVKAIKKIKFKPALKDEEPVSVRLSVEFSFNLLHEAGKDGVSHPLILEKVKPEYTEQARKQKIEGIVQLEALFHTNGKVSDIRIVRGLPAGLNDEAIKAAQQIKFTPATNKHGNPVSALDQIEFEFKLNP